MANVTSRRWRRNLIAWGIVLTLLALIAFAVVIYQAYQREAAALVIERDRQLTYLSAARLKDELGNFSNELIALARTPGMYRGERNVQRAELQKAGDRLAIFDDGVVLVDNFGKVQGAVPERPEVLGRDWSGSDFFNGLLAGSGPIFSDLMDDQPNGPKTVAIGVPILGENGEFVGALAGILRLGSPTSSSLYASIVRLRIGQTGNTYLLDGKGRILYDSDYISVGQTLSPAELPGLQQTDAGAARTRDADGNDVVAARARLAGTPWTLVTEDDWAILNSSSLRYANVFIVLLLAGIIVPAVGLTLLLRERQAETQERERAVQELHAASLIQQTLLPHQVPMMPGWNVAVHYQPAEAVGGDFYDMMFLPDGRLMITLGDIADRSIPAALVIATTRATLRGVARRMLPPGQALEQANELLCPEMLPNMCVFCLYLILDPSGGRLELANAGHLLPYIARNEGVEQLTAVGRPLGLMLDSQYRPAEAIVRAGEYVVLCSNGLIEARNPEGEMFGLARLKSILHNGVASGQELLDLLLAELHRFTGDSWLQHDDVTVLVLERSALGAAA